MAGNDNRKGAKNAKSPGFCITCLAAFLPMLFFATSLFSQSNPLLSSEKYEGLTWTAFVKRVEDNYPLHFFYREDLFNEEKRIHFQQAEARLFEVLTDYLADSDISFSADRHGNLFFEKGEPVETRLSAGFFAQKPAGDTARTEDQNGAGRFLETSNEFVGKAITVGNEKDGAREQRSTVSGFITDAADGTPIIGAAFLVTQSGAGTATDESGFYSIQLKKGVYTVEVSNMNHELKRFELTVLSSGKLDLALTSKAFLLNSVVVRSDPYNNVSGAQMGFEKLAAKDVRSIPMVLGEGDLLKVAQLLPGVQSVGEGTSGFNVRGSPADQNLFFLDNIPIYNTAHFLGFFSVFNSDAIQDFSILKSNIPANYGGRLASILEVQSKTGNRKKFSARGGISPITGNILVEGPIVKEKASYLLSYRSTYSDWILQLVPDENIKKSSGRFADLLGNVSVELNEKNQLKVLGYYSTDDTRLAGNFNYAYENKGASLNWKRFFKDKHSLDIDLVHASYNSVNEDEQLSIAAYRQNNSLEHNAANASLTLRPANRLHLVLGLNTNLYRLSKGSIAPLGPKSQIKKLELGDERGLESALFAQGEWTVSPAWSVNAGIRFNLFNYLGPGEVFEYEAGQPFAEPFITDTLSYAKNANIVTYFNPDLRLASRLKINPRLSLKCSYNRLHQYLFLLSNTIALTPSDRWKLVDPHIKPMAGDQFSLGLYSNLLNERIELSAEAYYKKVANQVEFRDGANLLISEVPEWDVLPGRLNAYGLELMLKKPRGNLNGWLNYTYSRTSVLVNKEDTGEQVNFGEPYPSNYDKPHSINLVTNYRFTRRFELSFNFVYSTGRPITLPAGAYFLDNYQIIHYSRRNEYRIPDYVRFDLSAKFEGNLSAKKFMHGTWIFSVYNLVGRRNAYSVYFINLENRIKGYKLSIFGAPIFSVSYHFKLGSYEE
ncbi:MAG: TonB-dependent receptor [Lewinellaceae bacterium]|nr:TonB-dependent receptor [Lewinellaceae bacterium]